MKDQEKHCNTCASSYYQEEKNVNGGKDMVRMQHCSDPRYNSPVYTNQMLKLSGIFSPIVIEAEGRDDFALVLPVRLKEEMAA